MPQHKEGGRLPRTAPPHPEPKVPAHGTPASVPSAIPDMSTPTVRARLLVLPFAFAVVLALWALMYVSVRILAAVA